MSPTKRPTPVAHRPVSTCAADQCARPKLTECAHRHLSMERPHEILQSPSHLRRTQHGPCQSTSVGCFQLHGRCCCKRSTRPLSDAQEASFERSQRGQFSSNQRKLRAALHWLGRIRGTTQLVSPLSILQAT
eukprot:6200213-Pleurochrysis_carterae.AAC.2